MNKPRIIKIFFICFIVIFSAMDFITAYFAQHDLLESNPIAVFFGGMFSLLIFKILITLVIIYYIWNNKYSSERIMFFFILAMTYFLFLLMYGVYANSMNLVNPVPPEYYQQVKETVTTGVKIATYATMSQGLYFRPIIISFIAYLIFEGMFPSARFKRRRLVSKYDK